MLNIALKSKIEKLVNERNFSEAHTLCVSLCADSPDDVEAHVLMGEIYGHSGDFKSAEDSLMKAFAISPNDPLINFNLGISLYHQNKFKDAVEYLVRAAQFDPQQFDVWFYLGMSCEGLGAKDNAIISFEHAIAIDLESVEVLKRLGRLYMESERWELAVEALERLFKMQPADANILSGFCVALCRAYQYERLLKNIEPVALNRSMDYVANYYVAQAYFEQADMVNAGKYFNRVLAANPDHIDSLVALASIKTMLGDHDEALRLISPLVNSHSDSPGVALSFSLIGPRFNRSDEAIRLLKKSLSNKSLPSFIRGKLSVSLAQIYEKAGNYEKAFKLFKQGNDLHSPHFDRASYMHRIKAIESVYSEDNVKLLPVADHSFDKPVFIVGMPRSGTSLVEQILASHPQVYGAGELKYIQNYSFDLSDLGINNKQYPECMSDVSQSQLEKLAEDYIERLEDISNGEDMVTDKMPINYQNLGLIYQLFPNAKIIHCTRDPMDTCVSCYCQFFSGSYYYTFDLDDVGFAYRAYEKQMRFWKKVLPIAILDVSYEELVKNQESVTKQILEYCELSWSEECLNFYKTPRTVATASVEQVRKPMYSTSVHKWRNYEKHVGALINSLEENKNI